MENIQLSLYKSLLNFEKISALEFMRKNPEFLDIPGYEISKILNEGIAEGYIKQFESADKMYYSATSKCREFFDKIESEKKEKEEFEANQARLRSRQAKTKAISIVSIICIVITFVIVLNSVIIPNSKYNDAINLMSNGEYEKAIYVFEALENYKDSKNKIDECNIAILDNKYNAAIDLISKGNVVSAYEDLIALNGHKDSIEKADSIYDKYLTEKLKTLTVGNSFLFGSYEQDNNNSNGNEKISWQVIAKEETKILVISEFALDCQHYDTHSASWDSSSLRTWLNNQFYDCAFSVEEKVLIPTATVLPDKSDSKYLNPGEPTQDKVFVLSESEAEKYFLSGSSRQCKPTNYAIKQGADVNEDGNCDWWLRTPGVHQYMSLCVEEDGDISIGGRHVDGVNADGYCLTEQGYPVRPVMWISIE